MTSLPLYDDLYQELQTELDQVEQLTDPVKQAVAGGNIAFKYLQKLREQVLSAPTLTKEEEIQLFKEVKPIFGAWLFHFQDRLELHTRRNPSGNQPNKKTIKQLMRRKKKYFKRNYDFYTYCRVGHTHHDEHFFLRSNYDWKANFKTNGVFNDPSFCTNYDRQLARMLAYDHMENYVLQWTGKRRIDNRRHWRSPFNWTGAKQWLKETVLGFRATGAVNNGQFSKEELAKGLGEFFNVKIDDIYHITRDLKQHKKTQTPFMDQMKLSIVKSLERGEDLD